MSNELILEKLKKEVKPIVIYGALNSDESIIHACEKMGIDIECICDDSLRKANSVWCNRPVRTFSDVIKKYGNVVFILNISYIKPIIEKIEKAGCEWYSCKVIVHSPIFQNLTGIEEFEYEKGEAERACYCHDNYLLPSKLYMSNIDVVVTERCSLRCKECSNLMQFYERPVDYGTDKIIQNVKKLLDIVDGIYELRFIGGEPFMNRDLHTIMSAFLEDEKVERLLIYTNATIVPNEKQWEVFDNKKIIFMITNYGKDKSRNFDCLIQELKNRKITYHVLRMDYWNPCDTFEDHHRNEDELEDIFKNCCVKNYVTLIGDKIFRCPYAAHAMNLSAVPYNENDLYDLSANNRHIQRKEMLREYLFNIKKMETCQYCSSRAFDSVLIPVAEQCEEPRKYKKYDNGEIKAWDK